MNIFRLAGDMTHLLSFLVLLLKIQATKSCRGISLRTQELYTLVFVCRYLDLFFRYVSLYNLLMKLVFLGASFTILYLMKYHRVVRQTYDKEQDTFRSVFIVVPCAVLAVLVHYEWSVIEVLWAFSIYLEAVAILPQLVLLQRTQNIDNLTGNYVFLLGTYRALYILNWVYRYFTEPGHRQWLVWLSGIVQTAIYGDFFYYYLRAWRSNEKLALPT
ncbi:hypothetical protein WJX73_003106 [Symbiochloris irregularis]|uniref:ER lumen protein-retaining receptor n=1 Tax=Symbiochloris irregularis TaxID=706552 RepID=A0AAW1PM57_9CHLO